MTSETEKALDFFYRDEDALKLVNEMLESGKPCRVIAASLHEYMNQLSKFELMAIYHRLMVDVVEATDWDEVANRMLCDWYGAHSDNNC